MIVGFVIIGRNEGPRLERCLRSALPYAAPVVYVDSGSTDDSPALAHSLGAQVVDLSPPFSAAAARNAGVAGLRNLAPSVESVMFLDGDTELHPAFLPAALDLLRRRPDVVVVCGRRRERFPDASLYNRLCDLEWNTPPGEALACGGDALMRLAPFLAAGGFNPAVVAGEEPELCSRLRAAGGKILRLDLEMTLHDAHIATLRQFLRRQIRSGYGGLDVERRTRASGFAAEIRRARLWALYLPLSILIAAIAALILPSPLLAAVALLLLLAYAAQFARLVLIAPRRGIPRRLALHYGAAMLLAKFPHLLGQVRYARDRLIRRRGGIIEYHQKSPQTRPADLPAADRLLHSEKL